MIKIDKLLNFPSDFANNTFMGIIGAIEQNERLQINYYT